MSAIKKVIAVAILAVGVSAIGFAGGDTSVVGTIENQETIDNGAVSVGMYGGRTSGGGSGGHTGGGTGGHNGGGTGGHTTGGSGGHSTGGGGGEDCPPVPEPASMLALGIGSGVVMLRKRFQKKA